MNWTKEFRIRKRLGAQKPALESATKHRRFFFRSLQTTDSEQKSAALKGCRFLLRICGQNLESAAQILRFAEEEKKTLENHV